MYGNGRCEEGKGGCGEEGGALLLYLSTPFLECLNILFLLGNFNRRSLTKGVLEWTSCSLSFFLLQNLIKRSTAGGFPLLHNNCNKIKVQDFTFTSLLSIGEANCNII